MTEIFSEIEFGSEVYQQGLILREQVLRAPLGRKLTPQDQEGEESQLHYALMNHHHLCAWVSFKPIQLNQYKLRQMAVDPSFHGQGLGSRLIQCAEQTLIKLKAKSIQMSARQVAQVFYQKLGYQPQGDYFQEQGITHILMEKVFR